MTPGPLKGGSSFNILEWTRKERASCAFDKKDPLGAEELRRLKTERYYSCSDCVPVSGRWATVEPFMSSTSKLFKNAIIVIIVAYAPSH
jgi:hypothetical protein